MQREGTDGEEENTEPEEHFHMTHVRASTHLLKQTLRSALTST